MNGPNSFPSMDRFFAHTPFDFHVLANLQPGDKVETTFDEFFRTRILSGHENTLILRAGQKLVFTDIELPPGAPETHESFQGACANAIAAQMQSLPLNEYYRVTNNNSRTPGLGISSGNFQVKREAVGTSITSTGNFLVRLLWSDEIQMPSASSPQPPSPAVKEFTGKRLKGFLEHNAQLTIPGSSILKISETPKESCFRAEWDMNQNVDTQQIICDLFRSSIGADREEVKIGSFGVLALTVSPEKEEWGIVSSEPLHIALDNEITHPASLKEIFIRMFKGSLPRSLTIRTGEKLLLKDFRFPVQCDPDGSPSAETIAKYLIASAHAFHSAKHSLNAVEAQRLTHWDRFTPVLLWENATPSRISAVAEGILVSFPGDFTLGFQLQPTNR